MSKFFFHLILIAAMLVRTPLTLVLIVFKGLGGPLKRRFDFERKNLIEEDCRSFKKDKIMADYCFEVSSEGELEQVRPLIDHFLLLDKKIEILFASTSVESKCQKLARDHGNQVRILRLPIVTYFPYMSTASSWMSSSKFIFCRYDFYPELLVLKFWGKKMILLSARAKKASWFKSQIFAMFDVIVAASASEAKYFKEHFGQMGHKKIFDFDFRIPRILKRAEKASETLRKVDQLAPYLRFLVNLAPSQKLIMGSAWESDFGLLQDEHFKEDLRLGKMHLLVVPHNLEISAVAKMKAKLQVLLPLLPIYEISKTKSEFDPSQPGIVLLNMSGVLCELYTQFESVYVGGGYARSIHSVLEPYLSGARVFCGPKVHRSSEFDFIVDCSPEEMMLLKYPESFYHLYKKQSLHRPNQGVREDIHREAQMKMDSIIKEIEVC